MAQRAPTRVQRSAPAEVLASLNLGYNTYTDPTLQTPRQWAAASNVYSGAFGYIQRARFANVVQQGLTSGYISSGNPFLSMKYFAIPGTSNYLLADQTPTNTNAEMWSFDTGNSYAATPRFNPLFNIFSVTGPWSREILQNIVYEMNGFIKQTGRNANAATIERWGLDAPDVSPQVVISSGSSQAITNIQRSNGTVTVTLAGALTVPGGNGIGMVNVTVSSGDTSFVGTFVVLAGSGTATLTWTQAGQNTSLLTPTGTVNTNITKSVGRSYSYAWENANKNHVGPPSPVTQYIQYNAQNGAIQLIEQGTISTSSPSTTVVTGVGTNFTSAWVGRSIWANSAGAFGALILSVQS